MPTAKLLHIYALVLSIVFMCFLSFFLKLYDFLTSIDKLALRRFTRMKFVYRPPSLHGFWTRYRGSQLDSFLLSTLDFKLSN